MLSLLGQLSFPPLVVLARRAFCGEVSCCGGFSACFDVHLVHFEGFHSNHHPPGDVGFVRVLSMGGYVALVFLRDAFSPLVLGGV